MELIKHTMLYNVLVLEACIGEHNDSILIFTHTVEVYFTFT